MKLAKKIATLFLSAVLWIIILTSALYAFTTLATRDTSKVASLAGFTPLIVETGSMSPTFDAGDLILIRSCDPASLQEGDVITFHTIINNEYALNTHRIESILADNGVRSYVTKGDNNEISDTHVIADGDIVGKYVTRVPYMGKVMELLSSSMGFLIIIVLPMILFFIYQVYHLVMVSISLKKALALEAAAAGATGHQTELEAARAEAEAALAEARRLKAEADAALAQAKAAQAQPNQNDTDAAAGAIEIEAELQKRTAEADTQECG
jgi:signal peptidase